MSDFDKNLQQLSEPLDYFKGIGKGYLPTPSNLLIFLRSSRQTLQQESLRHQSHHRFVLIFNLETEGKIQLDSLSLSFEPGQALLVLPYQFHHFNMPASPGLKWLFCTFDLEPQEFLEPLRNRVVDIGQKTRSILEELLREWHSTTRDLKAEQLQAIMLRVLLSFKQDRHVTGEDLPPEPKDNLLRQINQLLSEWRGRTMLVSDIANKLLISESHLRSLFMEAAGIPLGRYIQNFRLNRAMALLRTSSLPMSAVAEQAGFGSPQSFSRVFKKETGQSPRVYRHKANEIGNTVT